MKQRRGERQIWSKLCQPSMRRAPFDIPFPCCLSPSFPYVCSLTVQRNRTILSSQTPCSKLRIITTELKKGHTGRHAGRGPVFFSLYTHILLSCCPVFLPLFLSSFSSLSFLSIALVSACRTCTLPFFPSLFLPPSLLSVEAVAASEGDEKEQEKQEQRQYLVAEKRDERRIERAGCVDIKQPHKRVTKSRVVAHCREYVPPPARRTPEGDRERYVDGQQGTERHRGRETDTSGRRLRAGECEKRESKRGGKE